MATAQILSTLKNLYYKPTSSSVQRTLDNKLSEIISVKDYGAVADGIVDDSAGILAAATVINSNGGGTLFFPKGIYKVTLSSQLNPNSLFSFTNLKGVKLQFEGSKIVTADTFTSGTIGWTLFNFSGCTNIEVSNVEVEGVDAWPLTNRKGIVAFKFQNACKNIKWSGKVSHVAYGIWSGDYGSQSTGNSSGFDVDMEFDDVGYPVAMWSSGNNGDYRLNGQKPDRAIYLSGTKNAKAVVNFKDANAPTTCLITSNPNNSNPAVATVEDCCENITLEVTDTGTTYYNGSNNWAAGIGTSTDSGTGKFDNITIRAKRTLDGSSPAGLGLVNFPSGGTAGVYNNVVELRNISVGGTLDRSAQSKANAGAVLYIGNGANQNAARLTNFRISDLVVVENSADPVTATNLGIVFTTQNLGSPVYWERVQAPLTPINLSYHTIGKGHFFRDCDVPKISQFSNGTLVNTSIKDDVSEFQNASGRNAGLFFSGGSSSTQRAAIPLSASIGTGSFTLELSFRTPNLNLQHIRGLAALSSVDTGAAASGIGVEVNPSLATPGDINIYFFGASLSDYIKYTIDGSRVSENLTVLHLVRDSNYQTIKFYINGREVGTTRTTAGTPPTNEYQSLTTTYLVLGQSRAAVSQSFYGTVYTSKVYGFSFTDKDVKQAIAGSSPFCSNGAVALPLISRTANNGSFETAGGGGSDVFGSWTESVSGTSTITQDTTDFVHGANSAKFTIDSSNSIAQLVNNVLVANRAYRISMWLKASASATVAINAGGNSYSFSIDTTWRQYTFVSYATSSTFSISRSSAASKSIWIDDVLVEEMGVLAAPNLRSGRSAAILDEFDATRYLTITGSAVASNLPQVNNGAYVETYGTTVTIDAGIPYDWRRIVVTNATAFTIAAPLNPVTGRTLIIEIWNNTGGAIGTITWNAVFKVQTITNPASTKRIIITFRYDGTNWIESSITGDV